jgi:hypothetical protein
LSPDGSDGLDDDETAKKAKEDLDQAQINHELDDADGDHDGKLLTGEKGVHVTNLSV